jgi:hypothetical protein
LLAVAALASACFDAAAAPVEQPVSAANADPGVWQKHEYSFQYLGFTSTYSCDGLADQLKRLLIAAGARADAKARPGACASGFGRPDKFARADLTFYTLAPSDSQSAAAASPPGAAPVSPVAGTWRPITLSQQSPHELKLGDCELVEQFRDKVLPMFATRNVENHTTCVPHELSGSVIDLKFDAFVAAKGAPGISPPTAAVTSAR